MERRVREGERGGAAVVEEEESRRWWVASAAIFHPVAGRLHRLSSWVLRFSGCVHGTTKGRLSPTRNANGHANTFCTIVDHCVERYPVGDAKSIEGERIWKIHSPSQWCILLLRSTLLSRAMSMRVVEQSVRPDLVRATGEAQPPHRLLLQQVRRGERTTRGERKQSISFLAAEARCKSSGTATADDGVREGECVVGLAARGLHLVADVLRHRRGVGGRQVCDRHAGCADTLAPEQRHLCLHLEPHHLLLPRGAVVEVECGDRVRGRGSIECMGAF
jgi:hypothetical protein